ncbi:MAG: acyl carrier protein [Bacteroidales bacterium]
MKNIELYNNTFIKVFDVDENKLNEKFTEKNIEFWDSLRQLAITNALEEKFDIMFDPEDIMEFNSYEKGKEILKKYKIIL